MIRAHRVAARWFAGMSHAERVAVRRHGAGGWRRLIGAVSNVKGRQLDATVRRVEWLAAGEPVKPPPKRAR